MCAFQNDHFPIIWSSSIKYLLDFLCLISVLHSFYFKVSLWLMWMFFFSSFFFPPPTNICRFLFACLHWSLMLTLDSCSAKVSADSEVCFYLFLIFISNSLCDVNDRCKLVLATHFVIFAVFNWVLNSVDWEKHKYNDLDTLAPSNVCLWTVEAVHYCDS